MANFTDNSLSQIYHFYVDLDLEKKDIRFLQWKTLEAEIIIISGE